MGPPPMRSKFMKPRTPPRQPYFSTIRRGTTMMSAKRQSLMASSAQIDTLTRVQKILYKNEIEIMSVGGVAGGCPAPKRPSRIQVAVRVRPLNDREQTANAREIVHVAGPNMISFDPPVEQKEFFFHNKKQKDVTAAKHKDLTFAFDYVYNKDVDNRSIFGDIMVPLVKTLLEGFNSSVFAYGATGSGKTFTMLGSQENPGLTYLTINELYKQLEEVQDRFESEIVISYLEVYNEKVRDLLNPTDEDLQIREVGNGIEIAKLSHHRPKDVHHVLEMLQRGNAQRSQHPTDHNAESSRSHAVLQVHVRMRQKHTDLKTNTRLAKLVMVDLAGSEKGTATGYTGQRFREGASINKSLLALSSCINAMAKGKAFAAFRDSKLTRILKDSLTGKSKTVMIANVSPSHTTLEDSLNTLRYADTAKKITCKAKPNLMTTKACLSQFTRVVEEMAEMIENLESRQTRNDGLLAKEREELDERQRLLVERENELKHRENELKLREDQLAKRELELRFREENRHFNSPAASRLDMSMSHSSTSVSEFDQTPTPYDDIRGLNQYLRRKNKRAQLRAVHQAGVQQHTDQIDMALTKHKSYNQLYDLTSDAHFKKAIAIQKRQMKKSFECSETYRDAGNRLASNSEYRESRDYWMRSVIGGSKPKKYTLTSDDLFQYMKCQATLIELRCRLKLLNEHKDRLLENFNRREAVLFELARILDGQWKLIKNRNFNTIEMERDMKKFISAYCEFKSVHFDFESSDTMEGRYSPQPLTGGLMFDNPDVLFYDDPALDESWATAESDDGLRAMLASTDRIASGAPIEESTTDIINAFERRVEKIKLKVSESVGIDFLNFENEIDVTHDMEKNSHEEPHGHDATSHSQYMPPPPPPPLYRMIKEEKREMNLADNTHHQKIEPRVPTFDQENESAQADQTFVMPTTDSNFDLAEFSLADLLKVGIGAEDYQSALAKSSPANEKPSTSNAAFVQTAPEVGDVDAISEAIFNKWNELAEANVSGTVEPADHVDIEVVNDNDESDNDSAKTESMGEEEISEFEKYKENHSASYNADEISMITREALKKFGIPTMTEFDTPGSLDRPKKPTQKSETVSSAVAAQENTAVELARQMSLFFLPAAQPVQNKAQPMGANLSCLNVPPPVSPIVETRSLLGNRSSFTYTPPPLSAIVPKSSSSTQEQRNSPVVETKEKELDSTFITSAPRQNIPSTISLGPSSKGTTLLKRFKAPHESLLRGYTPSSTQHEPRTAASGKKGARTKTSESPPKPYRGGGQRPGSGTGPHRTGATARTRPVPPHPYNRQNPGKKDRPPGSNPPGSGAGGSSSSKR